MKKIIYFGIAALISSYVPVSSVSAADIAREVRVAESSPEPSDGGFFEAGAGFVYGDAWLKGEDDGLGLAILLGGRYQWNGLFVEAIEGSSSLISVGYNAWNNDNWSLDVLGSNLNDLFVSDDNEELESLKDRDADFLLGARATGYFGDYLLQLQLQGDVSSTHDGVIASIEGGRSWQYRNWNFHTLAGLRYHSKEVVDVYVGVTPAEATATLPEFKAGSGSILSAEIGATYPISEHWVFRATAGYQHLTEGISESPIIDGENFTKLKATFSYVF